MPFKTLNRIIGPAMVLLAALCFPTSALAQSHLDLVKTTPCLTEYRLWFFTFRRSELFVSPKEFTTEQCEYASRVHLQIQTDQSQTAAILKDHPPSGDESEQKIACLREYRIWKLTSPVGAELEPFLQTFPPFKTYEPAQCLAAKDKDVELNKRQALAAAAQVRELAVQQQRAAEAQREEEKRKLERSRVAKLPGVRIGMTVDQVLSQSHWGRPWSINRTTSATGVREQWVYGEGQYLYFDNGRLTTIQN